MKAFEIRTTKSDYPFLVIADGFKEALELQHQKGIYDSDIISVRQIEEYKDGHILHEYELKTWEELKEEVRKEIRDGMPKWRPEPNGAGGGCDHVIYLIRTSKGHYFTSNSIGGDNYYLVLDELEQLGGLPDKED